MSRGCTVTAGITLLALSGAACREAPRSERPTASVAKERSVPKAAAPAAASPPPANVGLPKYEVAGRKMLNAARIIEIKTDAPTHHLKAIATDVIKKEGAGASIVRVFFYFPGETPGQGLPRYRVEQSDAGTRVDDFTERRKIAGLRY